MLEMRTRPRAPLMCVPCVLFMCGCEIDLENGTYQARATGLERYSDGSSLSYEQSFDIVAQLAEDARGPRPDTLVFTLCNDAIDSPIWQPCFPQIELEVSENTFGGDGYNSGYFEVSRGGDVYSCSLSEDLVLSGELIDETHFDFTLSYVSSIDTYDAASPCADAVVPTGVTISGTAVLSD